jgi:hypothetical protein
MYVCTKLYGVISQKKVIFIVTVVTTPNLTEVNLVQNPDAPCIRSVLMLSFCLENSLSLQVT